MSEFVVPYTKIKSIKVHPDADRLEIATVEGFEGYEVAVGKGEWAVGDACIYFPIESVLPDELIIKMGLEGRLSKFNGRKCMVSTKELPGRSGFYSQGIIWSVDIVSVKHQLAIIELGDYNVAEILGVTKMEKIEVVDGGGKPGTSSLLKPGDFPSYLHKYDVDDWQKNSELFNLMKKRQVVALEKVEGSNCWLSIGNDFEIHVGQRSGTTPTANEFGKAWHKTVIENFMETAHAVYKDYVNVPGFRRVAIRGEIIGEKISGGAAKNNYYDIEGMTCYAFDIEVNGVPLDYADLLKYCYFGKAKVAPMVDEPGYIDSILLGKGPSEYANGMSMINPDVMREGVVFRAVHECNIPRIGRMMLKAVSPAYLLSKGK